MTLVERGASIRAERQRQGLSQYRAAIKAGVHPNSVILAEKGAASPAIIERIASALGIELPEGQP